MIVGAEAHRAGFRAAVWPYLRLMRPANVVTAAADVLAGYAAAGLPDPRSMALLLVSTTGLYAGGVALNDAFDAKLDALERPERPIPSGQVTVQSTALLGAVLLLVAVTVAFAASALSGALALVIAALAVLYDFRGKHKRFLGPVNMAACRGLNVLLGVSAAPLLVSQRWYVGLVNFLFVAAITILSAGEVHGGKRSVRVFSLLLLTAAIAGVLMFGMTPGFMLVAALPFLMLFSWRVLPPFWRACLEMKPATIRRAVVAGVLSLIVLDSAIAAGYAGVFYGAGVLALSLVAGRLARLFAVT